MDKNEVLDSNVVTPELNIHTNRIIESWENKRWFFNSFLILTQIIVLLAYRKGTIAFGLDHAIFLSVLYSIVANCFYSIGWALELQINFYFPKFNFNHIFKRFLWLIGTVFSILLTWIWYEATLSSY